MKKKDEKLECPICGNKKLRESVQPPTYKWNEGLPKTLTRKEWSFYGCDKCWDRGIGCAFFVFLPKRIFIWTDKDKWVNIKTKWDDINKVFNPSRRCFPDKRVKV